MEDAETCFAVPVLTRVPTAGRPKTGVGDMRLASISLLLALVIGLYAPALSASRDLDKITCKELLDEDEENISFTLAMLCEFLLGRENKPAIDLDRIDADTEKFSEVCEERPDATAFSVAAETLSR